MKVIVEFELPDERQALDVYRQAWEYRLVVCDLLEWLRLQRKHEDGWTSEAVGGMNAVWDKLHELMVQYGVEL